MILHSHYLSDSEKQEICTWKYEGDYEVYNLPSYEEMQKRNMSFVKPECANNYRGYYHEGMLVGFTNIREEEREVFVGVGVRPKMCNQGYGQLILNEAYAISKQLYPEKSLYLEVRAWNQRAINCYLKAGFLIKGEPYQREISNTTELFYRMVKE